MKLFNYKLTKITPDGEIKRVILDKAEQNAKAGLVQANLELTHHTLLLEQLPEETEDEDKKREIRLTKEAIERDLKTINNWQTQLKAIEYERNN